MSFIINSLMNYMNANKEDKATTSISFTITENTQKSKIDEIVKGAKINSIPVQNSNEYSDALDKVILQNINHKSFLDGLYLEYCGKVNTITEVEKMKELGRIGTQPTILDQKSFNEKPRITFCSRKIEAIQSFSGARTNTCVTKGKWCYEVEIVTNGLLQLGWCQLSTPFTSKLGVGDDITSYAVDGWRKVKWHGQHAEYGKLWDVGDIVGCCIDIDNQKIEYFLNGEKMGIAFENIPKGKNFAYFPGLSLSQGEKCIFNFGQKKLKYKYEGYLPIDIPLSKLNGVLKVTEIYLNVIKDNLLQYLNGTYEHYEKVLLFFKIFNFLSTESFKDLYTIETMLVPFLYELSLKNEKELNSFWTLLIEHSGNKECQKQFVLSLFDIISNMIQESSLLGEKQIEFWSQLISVFLSMLKNDLMVTLWYEQSPDIQLEQLKVVFYSNCIHYGKYYDYLKGKYQPLQSNPITCHEAVIDTAKGCYSPEEKNNSIIEERYSQELIKLLYFILNDKRKYPQKGQNKTIKDLFNELVRKGYGIGDINNVFGALGIYRNVNKDDPFFYKNIFYNLLYLFCKGFINKSFDNLTTEPWFNRSQSETIYFDEVGLGGTISHVTTEYINQIENTMIIKNDEFYPDFFHKLIKLSNDLLVNSLFKTYLKDVIQNKKIKLSSYLNFIDGATDLQNVLRKPFYLFNLHAQKIFYSFSFFLIKYLLWIKDKNPKMLYFVPIIVAELPFSFFRLLMKLRSKTIFDAAVRAEINKSSIHFEKDDYVQSIIEFYIYLFSDKTIANPELREKFLYKVNFFIKKNSSFLNVNGNESLFNNLINGLMNDIKVESLSLASCSVLLSIVGSMCLGYEEKCVGNEIIKKVVQYYQKNQELLKSFLTTFFDLVNKKMTSFTIFLSELTDKLKLNPELFSRERRIIAFQSLFNAFNEMKKLLLLIEFFVDVYPEEFLDLNSLNSLQFIILIKNISTRILSEPYMGNLSKAALAFTDSMNHQDPLTPKKSIDIVGLCSAIVGIILKINKSKNHIYFENFIKKLVNSSDFLFEPFETLITFMKNFPSSEKIKPSMKMYSDFLSEIKKYKDTKEKTIENYDKLVEEDKICILCYINIANVKILPCKHKACEECMNIYRMEKDTCFICHSKIESVEKIDSK